MRTLVIYDNTGFIIGGPMSGNVREPVGVPFMWVEVPEGKYIQSIDVSGEEHTPVFIDLPKNELDLLKEQIALQEAAILELSMLVGGGL